MGKVHLMKTYALSKLNYISSLIVVPKWVMSEVDKITFEFLWNGKDRIKRTVMCQDYKNGGIRMTNYRLSIKAQRICWVRRLLYGNQDMGWKRFFNYCCRSVGGRFILMCDYEVSKMHLEIPKLYMEILEAWEDIRECRNMEGELINPIIFSNRNICLKGKLIFDASLFAKEIFAVDHLLNKGRVKSIEYFQNLGMNSKNLLMITDICNAIPDDLKNERALAKFQHIDLVTRDIELKVLGQKLNLRDMYSRKIYAFLVNELQNSFSLQIKDGHSNFNYTDEEIRDIFVRPRRTTILNKHREFQYKLIHGVIYTKEQLFKYGFVGNNLCSFCQQEIETYAHVFLHCKKVEDIWKNLITHYDLKEIKNMAWEDIFVGLSGSSIRIKFVNSLIIMLKYMILSQE